VARGFTALLETGVTGPVNVASGVATQVRDVALLLGELTGRPQLVRLGAVPTPPGDPALLVADVSRLRHESDWEPTYDLRDGLAQTVEWWRARL
jgi:nucleoside-diphosphate-sugar epimerase